MSNLKFSIWALLLFSSLFIYSSCDPDPKPINEEELITTVVYLLTPSDGSDTAVMSFQDLDGDGGTPPIFFTDDLKANTTYKCALSLSNEAVSPATDISNEVKAEGVDHQLFYTTTVPNLVVAYTDNDANNKPLGLTTSLQTGAANTTGILKITLRHLPNKSATNVSNGDITNAGGETDIEVAFSVNVK